MDERLKGGLLVFAGLIVCVAIRSGFAPTSTDDPTLTGKVRVGLDSATAEKSDDQNATPYTTSVASAPPKTPTIDALTAKGINLSDPVLGDRSKNIDDKACRESVSCYSQVFWIDAEVLCSHFIESKSKYDFKWINTWSSPKFPREDLAWVDSGKGKVRLVGDQVRFQNSTGAWMRMSYSCEYNGEKRIVERVTVSEADGNDEDN